MRLFRLAALVCFVPLAVQAEVRPKVLPDRDVVVTYRSSTEIDRVSYSASQRVFRHMQGEKPVFMLMNTRDNTMRVVSDKHRATFLLQGIFAEGPFPWDPAMRFRKVGQDTVAGLACTEWQMTMAGKRGTAPADQGRICLTADGVMLRHGDAESGEVATAVVYAAQDPAEFRVPVGYRVLTAAEAVQLE